MTTLAAQKPKAYLFGMTVWSTVHRLAGKNPEIDGYTEIEETYCVPGGEAGNSAIVLSQWGYKVKLTGTSLGTETRDHILSSLGSKGIDCSSIPIDDSFEGVRDLILLGAKTRTIFGRFGQFFRGPKRWAKPVPEDIAWSDIVGLDPFFAEESLEVARHCAAMNKAYVTLDCPPREFLHRNSAATVISAEYLRNQFPGADPEKLLREYADEGRGLTIFTFGADKILFARKGGGIQCVTPCKITPKCTLGAGDTFRGGVMHAIFSGMDDIDVVRFAAATAACVCLRFPMFADPPSLAEIRAMAARM